MNDTVITRSGLERLNEELDYLSTTGRRQVAEQIRTATAAEANVAENADYQGARDEQALLERRITVLTRRLVEATIAEPDADNGMVDVGERVRLRDLDSGDRVEYELVGTHEADPSEGRVSAASPVGQALLGRRRGQIAVVEAPKGRQFRFKILAIHPARTEPSPGPAVTICPFAPESARALRRRIARAPRRQRGSL
jgi:transcription elongation factor GreA